MVYTLIDAAQARWRAVNAPQLSRPLQYQRLSRKTKLPEYMAGITPTEPDTGSTESEVT
jgi:hypothetical protein